MAQNEMRAMRGLPQCVRLGAGSRVPRLLAEGRFIWRLVQRASAAVCASLNRSAACTTASGLPPTHSQEIPADYTHAPQLGVRSAPTRKVTGDRYAGEAPLAAFRVDRLD